MPLPRPRSCPIQDKHGTFISLQADVYGWPATTLLRPLLGLFHGERGGKKFKDKLMLGAIAKKLGLREVIDEALEEVPLWVLDAPCSTSSCN